MFHDAHQGRGRRGKSRLILSSLFLSYSALAHAQEGTAMYVGNNFDGSVSVIDTSTNTVNNTITGLGNPEQLAAAGTGLYTAGSAESILHVIDLGTLQSSSISLPSFASPYALYASGTGVYIGTYDDGVLLYDITTQDIHQISPMSNVNAFALSGTGLYAGGDGLAIIDISNNVGQRTVIPASSYLGIVGFAQSGTGMYAICRGDNTVKIINTLTDTYSSVSLGAGANPMAIAPAGTGMYIAAMNQGKVMIIDTNNRNISSVTVGNAPQYLCPSGTGMYVSNSSDSNVTVIDTTNYHKSSIDVGSNPYALASAGTGMYVAIKGEAKVTVIDLSSFQTSSIGVGISPQALLRGAAASPPPPNPSHRRSAGLFGVAGVGSGAGSGGGRRR